MILTKENLNQLAMNGDSRKGCIVDTNVIFAASFPLDSYNEWAEEVFTSLQELEIPVFTNINIRSEFIELNRRVLIPEGLIEFYHDFQGTLSTEIDQKLKSLKTLMDRALKDGRPFKLSDADIKRYRNLLSQIELPSQKNAWDYFCEHYFYEYIVSVWDEVVGTLKLQFLGTRAIDSKEQFIDDPKWDDMLDIVGSSGIGTADAMIINLFLKSKLPIIATADNDVCTTILSLVPANKFVLAPR